MTGYDDTPVTYNPFIVPELDEDFDDQFEFDFDLDEDEEYDLDETFD